MASENSSRGDDLIQGALARAVARRRSLHCMIAGRVIPFGSGVPGEAGEGSDIDPFRIKEVDQQRIERRMEVERLLSDRQIPIDLLIYTPMEIHKLYAAGSPLIEEIMENGRVLYR